MKKKDIVYLLVAVVIFLVVGYVGLSQFGSPSSTKSKGVVVEVVDPISPNFDQNAMNKLRDTSQFHDFAVPVDLTTGLGNPAPIGSF